MDSYSEGTLILHIILLVKLALGDVCDSLEYSVEKYCCLRCHPGSHVQKHCAMEDRDSTQCTNCTKGTYMDRPNGLPECFMCLTCDAGTHVDDVVCERCLDGTFSDSEMAKNCTKWTD
ncbi:tumor necrosis factor receptor superfamily member 14-like isoform X2 [Protopterus annectens]|uniref:tumor necrosis factor receptor superfamily member 14-like isoform X2 n=1 Tax=Protopterus annectens TaxID=7888 RepID=UPI001CF99E05|nr:tumor necrosis factor receptor superfamily member 14-like isoform X2 [Protopterus annectens]